MQSPEIDWLKALAGLVRQRLAELRAEGRDSGYTTETVVVTALLIALAIAALALIANKVRDKASGLDLG